MSDAAREALPLLFSGIWVGAALVAFAYCLAAYQDWRASQ